MINKIVFLGAGAVGTSCCAWLTQKHHSVYLLARGKAVEVLRARGAILYQGDTPEKRETVPVNVIADLSEVPDADVVIITAKLFNLEGAARQVREKLGQRPLVVGMQNGLENQGILPRYFPRVVYCVVGYNCWMDAPGEIGYQKRGPLILGTPDNSLRQEMQELANLFNPAIETVVTARFQDVAHCKLVINLSNSVTTLVGLNRQPISDMEIFQDIIANTLYEGVQVLRTAGFHEERMGGIPSWMTLWAAARLPHFLSRGTFRRNIKKMVRSSMTQDLLFQRGNTELEYLNGYLLALAEKHGAPVPYNQAVYHLCKEHFSKTDFTPLDVQDVWAEVQKCKAAQ
jgi:2-dehydropantoate 2-reductase